MAKSEKKAKDGAQSAEKRERKKHRHMESATKTPSETTPASFSLLADETTLNPTLSSLFAVKTTPKPRASQVVPRVSSAPSTAPAGLDESPDNVADLEKPSVSLNGEANIIPLADEVSAETHPSKRKRKRKGGDEVEVEDAYMRRLVLEEAKEAEAAAIERAAKRQKALRSLDVEEEEDDDDDGTNVATETQEIADDQIDPAEDSSEEFIPPRHEAEEAADLELDKAKRTVFLGNVSISAISSKSARKALIDHLRSFFESLPEAKEPNTKHSVESIRFRSTPYASAIPKKASFVKKDVMEATTKSTNAYAIYSSPTLAREAVKRLNGSVVLDRHLRVDSVAHPAAVDHRRCVFVGNLGFVDDESNIDAAEGEEGQQKRKKPKPAADVEEGLWRTFAKCGTVESVRVVRDSGTRVGKGIAYVQFGDGNAVEAALSLDGKKFPPMLPRYLRVSRAKAMRKNPKPSDRAGHERPASANGYRRKITAEEASKTGRASKLFGKAAGAQARRSMRGDAMPPAARLPEGMKKPESFVFEGHRAKDKGGNAGLKLGKKKGGKPTNRSARRGTAFKAGRKKA